MIENIGVRQLVNESGITYKQIAEHIGYTPEYLCRCMRYKLKPEMQLRITRAVEEIKTKNEFINKRNESAIKRQGFMIGFTDWMRLEGLSDSQFRAVFRAILRYAETGEETAFSDPTLKLAFSVMKSILDDEANKYVNKIMKAKAAGKISASKRRIINESD